MNVICSQMMLSVLLLTLLATWAGNVLTLSHNKQKKLIKNLWAGLNILNL